MPSTSCLFLRISFICLFVCLSDKSVRPYDEGHLSSRKDKKKKVKWKPETIYQLDHKQTNKRTRKQTNKHVFVSFDALIFVVDVVGENDWQILIKGYLFVAQRVVRSRALSFTNLWKKISWRFFSFKFLSDIIRQLYVNV